MLKTMVPELVAAFRQIAETFADDLERTETDPLGFMVALAGVRSLANAIGRETFLRVVERFEEPEDIVETGDGRQRFKQVSGKRWLTPFGAVEVPRRLYQADAGGRSYVPIDVRTGMVDRFLTPDVEEWVAMGSAMMSPAEVTRLLDKIMPCAPSATAVQRTVRDVGDFAETHDEAVEEQIASSAPMTNEGDVLVVSWDGVHVPVRGAGERSVPRSEANNKVNWREAGTGVVSTYRSPEAPDDDPERLDARYFGRMPEQGMTTLVCQMEQVVMAEVARRSFREIVVLCDGKEDIWKAASAVPAFDDAVWILDFYHAVQNMKKAAKAIFGDDEEAATRWHRKYRRKLRDEPGGCRAAIRSMKYYGGKIRRWPSRLRVLQNAWRYFERNEKLMDYAEFRAMGLPIGSGPVEAACKTLVAHRMKRSGMRWSLAGGQEVLNLRRHLLSNRWDALWTTYTHHRCAAA